MTDRYDDAAWAWAQTVADADLLDSEVASLAALLRTTAEEARKEVRITASDLADLRLTLLELMGGVGDQRVAAERKRLAAKIREHAKNLLKSPHYSAVALEHRFLEAEAIANLVEYDIRGEGT
jgi:hypothetical protein